MFNKCYKCFRPVKSCYCSFLSHIETGVKFIFLMHPKEAFRQKTGTGRLTSLSLNDSEIIIGIDFTRNERLNALISGTGEYAKYFPVVLYPANNAYFTDTPSFRDAIGGKTLLVIIVDATWFFAQKMVNLSTNLHSLPKLSFKNEYRSQFLIKAQPAPACLSTIESAYYLIEELKAAGIANPEADQSGLMSVFQKMVQYQITCTQKRHEIEAQEQYPEFFM
jgi:DTW domain-containing protein YfiP